MQTELKLIDQQINRQLEQETFPETITPDYLREAVLAYPRRGGKRLRPALTFWTCGVVGGEPAKASHAALAVELYHNWTLIHDDIIDDDPIRRGQPSCHILLERAMSDTPPQPPEISHQFGRNMAILAGDILHGWAIDVLNRSYQADISPVITNAIVARMCGWLTPKLISGEALDVEFESTPPQNPGTIETMLRLKTGVLLQFAAETGAMIGLNTPDHQHPTVRLLGEFAMNAGLAFQLQDDILGMFGDEAILGKPVGSDLREGKQTLLYQETLKHCSASDRAALSGLWGNTEAPAEALNWARDIMTSSGALKAVTKRASILIDQAQSPLTKLPDNQYRHLLKQWADFLLNREL